MEQNEKVATFAETSKNKEGRKTLRIPLPVIKQHLIDNVVLYCSSSYEELLEGLCSFYNSFITKEVAEEPYTDFLPILQPHVEVLQLVLKWAGGASPVRRILASGVLTTGGLVARTRTKTSSLPMDNLSKFLARQERQEGRDLAVCRGDAKCSPV
jgi:hypothetical protein